MRRAGWVVVAVVVCVGLTLPGRAAEQIAFIRDGNLWLMDVDGSDQVQLSQSGRCTHPSWSPDGKYVVFSNAGDIWRMRPGDRSLRKLTTTCDCRQPAWRPGTSEVWFVRVPEPRYTRAGCVTGEARLWRVESEGGAPQEMFRIGPADGPGRSSWRPDGLALTCEVCRDEPPMAHVHYVTGADELLEARVPEGLCRAPAHLDPAWCPADPDLVAIAGADANDDAAGIWLLSMGSATPRRVIGTQAAAPERCLRFPLWDGLAAESAALQAITITGESLMWPSWAPDGKRLAFVHDLGFAVAGRQRGFPTIWIVDMTGQNAKMVAEDAIQPAWSPGTK